MARGLATRARSESAARAPLAAVRPAHLRDTIAVRGLEVRMHAGLDAWGRAVPQPVHIDAVLRTDVERAGRSDHLPYSLNYGEVYRALEAHCRAHRYDDVGALADALAQVCREGRAPWVELTVRLPRALLRAAHVAMTVVRSAELAGAADAYDRLCIDGLEAYAILGVNAWERETRQRVCIHLDMAAAARPVRYEALARAVEALVEASSYQTVESLATDIARLAIVEHGVEELAVRVEKPSAIMYAECASVEVVRDRAFFGVPADAPPAQTGADGWRAAALALGSNLGDRLAHLEAALARLDAHPDVRVVDTSFLYETQPMYYTEQPRFLNGACRIQTRLAPHDLLRVTQAIETDVGRTKAGVPRNGPRVVDVDLLLYEDAVVEDGEHLVVPHPRIAERAFVLHPLADIMPNAEHPVLQRTVAQLLHTLMHTAAYDARDTARVLPLAHTQWRWGERTLVMGILNATPDSFSDAGELADVDAAVDAAERMVRAGADMLDVGGQSTAPGAPEVPEAEEAARVVRVIRALVARGVQTPISVDTYRASVARAALDAGAAIVNDVSGGTRDADMLPLVAARRCPYVLMHSRGDAQTMTRLTDYGGDVAGTVAAELAARVRAALDAGVRRWNIILDPGLGFAKNAEGSVALLRALPRLVGAGGSRGGLDAATAHTERAPYRAAEPWASLAHFPLLLGASRKRFLGALIRAPDAPVPEPKARVYATLAACTAAIASGCVDVIRVHDVAPAVDTARTADALTRAR
ncbi:trifunctional dihydropteroate synthetase [Malassezia obtusa]|uniref:Folic acid synthesis protein FOL1 n=1 Tax=Malassezia obtusa TaxID=76774 RepID=A0AAF0IUK9_9BASI|nr:trifunctional dihydropteroate synthetase [Malassezia obtusa]